jgi:carboxyl-terminal processing protease
LKLPHIITLLSTFLFLAGLVTAVEQTPVISGMIRNVTEMSDILEKKQAVIEASASSNITAAIIKTIDPHAEILTKEQADRRAEELRGIFYDVGMSLTLKNRMPVIKEVLKDGPADSANLKAGNIVEKINDQPTHDLPLENIISQLRGSKDAIIKLTVRSGEKNTETNECSLKRTVRQSPVTGLTEQWSYQICYMKINGLYENSGAEITTQMVAWASAKCSGIILDLRNANGTDLQSAADVAALFSAGNAAAISTMDGNSTVTASFQSKAGKTINAPLMVLINGETCGTAEALAAALGKCRGVLLVGTPTRGDDSVREFIPISDGRVIYLATRRIGIDGCPSYHGIGINPHITVAQSKEQTKSNHEQTISDDEGSPVINLSDDERFNRALLRRTRGDAVLQRATDILLGLKALNIKGH